MLCLDNFKCSSPSLACHHFKHIHLHSSLSAACLGVHQNVALLRPEQLDWWLWQPAIITSVYLIFIFLSEPLSIPLSPLTFSPRTRSLTPLGRSAFLEGPLWAWQRRHRKNRKQESTYAHTDDQHTCAGACRSSQRICNALLQQIQACLYSEVLASSSKGFRETFFFPGKMIFVEDQWMLNHSHLRWKFFFPLLSVLVNTCTCTRTTQVHI